MNSDNIPDNISTFKISNRDTKLEDGYTVKINVPKTAVCDDGTDFSACFAAIWGLFFGYHYALPIVTRMHRIRNNTKKTIILNVVKFT